MDYPLICNSGVLDAMEFRGKPLLELFNQLIEVVLLSLWLSHLLHYLKHLGLEYSLTLILLCTLLSQILLRLDECCHELVELFLRAIPRRTSLVVGHTIGLGRSTSHNPVKYSRLVPICLELTTQY